MHDVIIIGARCAGSGLGTMLARAGAKVLVIDRAEFPSDTMSGHYIQPAGVSCLRRHGLLERLEAIGTPAQHRMTIDFGPVSLTGEPAAAPDGTSTGYAPRRFLFDPMLAAAAVEAGADLRLGVTFVEPLVDDGRVVGVKALDGSGREIELRARLVVGADGKRSRFARLVGAETYDHNPATACTYYAYWSGFDTPHVHLFVRDGRFIVVAPTDHGLTFIGVMWPIAEYRRVRSDIGRAYHDAAAGIPWIADRLSSAVQEERFIGTADLDGFFRRASGPGWALVGDAGYHKDPITAQGMTDALLDAELLCAAALDGLSGRRPLELALAEYQQLRDRRAGPMYGLTNDLARLAPPSPEMADLIGALAGNPEGTRRFLGVMAGTVSIPDFFAPANLGAMTNLAA